MSKNHDKIIALAGILQSAAIVQQLARSGETNEAAFKSSINSVFALNPSSTLEVYGSVADLDMGLHTIQEIFRGKHTKRYADTLEYSRDLLRLEKRLSKEPDMLAIIRSRIEGIEQQIGHFDNNYTHPTVVSKLATLYVDTVGTFNFRIMIKGNPNNLQDDTHVARIRATLLAGIRATMLWRQVGGSRLQLLFKSGELLKAMDELIAAHKYH